MSIQGEFVLHGIQTPTSFLTEIENAHVSPGISMIMGIPTGLPAPTFAAVGRMRPLVGFDTNQLTTLLALTGVYGANLSAGNTDLYWKSVTDFGQRYANASTVHQRMRMTAGFLIPRSITAGDTTEARCSCELHAMYDGTNDPIVPTGSVALVGTESSAEHFVAGPVEVNSSTLGGVQQIQIDFGIKLIRAGGDGEVFDTFIAVAEAEPTITITIEGTPWQAISLYGASLSALSVYLRRKAPGGNNYSNGSSQHILFSATAGMVTVDQAEGGGNKPSTTRVVIHPVAPNTTTAPMVITTGTTIS